MASRLIRHACIEGVPSEVHLDVGNIGHLRNVNWKLVQHTLQVAHQIIQIGRLGTRR